MSKHATLHDIAAEDLKAAAKITAVRVYEAPLRLWHWVNAFAIVTLCLSGYFIGSPLPTMPGEASDNYLMGYIRFAHFAAAMVFTVGFIGRMYWAMVGNHHARQLFILPFWNSTWWKEVIHEIQWYLFLKKEPRKYVGHNPLAQLAMFFFIVLGSLFMIATGMALYGEGLGQDHWISKLFGWVIPLFGQSMDVHTWHHMGMWIFIVFTMIHIYVAVREDIMSRQSIVSTMISGVRTFKDERPD
jgi:Ni/Fe-hydrogenase 1 B-type cytochrome subunit